MAPTYAFNTISRYVEGNVGTRIIEIYKSLATFIEETGPIIEDIQQRSNIINNIPLGKLTKFLMENSFRDDLKQAKKGLSGYNRIYGKTDLYLGLMSSNFRLPEFLKMNGIPADQIEYFQKEVNVYWEITYGIHLDHLEKCKYLLDKLRLTLEKEVKLLETIPQDSYFLALEENSELFNLFQEERDTFWQLANTAQLKAEETNILKNLIQAQLKKLQVEMKALSTITKNGLEKDIKESKSRLEKLVITITYLLGALSIIIHLPNRIKKKVALNFFNRISDEERLSNTGKILVMQALELMP